MNLFLFKFAAVESVLWWMLFFFIRKLLRNRAPHLFPKLPSPAKDIYFDNSVTPIFNSQTLIHEFTHLLQPFIPLLTP